MRGSEYRIFEVIQPQFDESERGQWACECESYRGNEFGVSLPLGPGKGFKEVHYGIDERNDARLVGRVHNIKWKNTHGREEV